MKAAGEVFLTFLKLGLTSFGGPIAHLGYFHRTFVEERRWVSPNQFTELLALCQFLPGPSSSQLGFSLGLLRAGFPGAIAAFAGFTLPSVALMIALASWLPALPPGIGSALVHGFKLVAVAVVAQAVIIMGRQLCPDWPRRIIAAGAAGVLLAWQLPWLQVAVLAGVASSGSS